MVSNIVKLDNRTKQHTQFGVSAINGSRDMAQTISWWKKKNEKKKKKLRGKKRSSEKNSGKKAEKKITKPIGW